MCSTCFAEACPVGHHPSRRLLWRFILWIEINRGLVVLAIEPQLYQGDRKDLVSQTMSQLRQVQPWSLGFQSLRTIIDLEWEHDQLNPKSKTCFRSLSGGMIRPKRMLEMSQMKNFNDKLPWSAMQLMVHRGYSTWLMILWSQLVHFLQWFVSPILYSSPPRKVSWYFAWDGAWQGGRRRSVLKGQRVGRLYLNTIGNHELATKALEKEEDKYRPGDPPLLSWKLI